MNLKIFVTLNITPSNCHTLYPTPIKAPIRFWVIYIGSLNQMLGQQDTKGVRVSCRFS